MLEGVKEAKYSITVEITDAKSHDSGQLYHARSVLDIIVINTHPQLCVIKMISHLKHYNMIIQESSDILAWQLQCITKV